MKLYLQQLLLVKKNEDHWWLAEIESARIRNLPLQQLNS